jgi:hypothetical protein
VSEASGASEGAEPSPVATVSDGEPDASRDAVDECKAEESAMAEGKARKRSRRRDRRATAATVIVDTSPLTDAVQ